MNASAEIIEYDGNVVLLDASHMGHPLTILRYYGFPIYELSPTDIMPKYNRTLFKGTNCGDTIITVVDNLYYIFLSKNITDAQKTELANTISHIKEKGGKYYCSKLKMNPNKTIEEEPVSEEELDNLLNSSIIKK